jgi:hypothetical protein
VHFQYTLGHNGYLKILASRDLEVLRAAPETHMAPPTVVAAQFDASDPDTFATVGAFLSANH